MPVGNDVIDLRDPETRAGSLHARFDLRVFTAEERTLLAESLAPERLRWCLWAAKESAFKVARKLDPTVRFLPRRFRVRLLDGLDGARAEVRHRAEPFRVWLEETRDRIHAVAVSGEGDGEPPPHRVERLAGARGLSARARELTLEVLAPLLPTSGERPRIVSRAGIPEVRLGARRLPFDLSLSHHGGLVACAWSPEASTAGSRSPAR